MLSEHIDDRFIERSAATFLHLRYQPEMAAFGDLGGHSTK